MKAIDFDYAAPASLDDALALMARDDVMARPVAGSQSLGPMLNLRLAQPDLLVDISRLPELTAITAEGDTLVIGACVTHARLEDADYPDLTRGVLPAVASGIAYRAVRTRGTIGGSLAHADPAADWVAVLTALGAEVELAGPRGRRRVAMDAFMVGAFETALEPGELLVAVRVPALSAQARWGYTKVCRKTGEFSRATGAVLLDPPRGVARCVVAAASGPPLVFDDPALVHDADRRAAAVAGRLDGIDAAAHVVALRRAVAQANSQIQVTP